LPHRRRRGTVPCMKRLVRVVGPASILPVVAANLGVDVSVVTGGLGAPLTYRSDDAWCRWFGDHDFAGPARRQRDLALALLRQRFWPRLVACGLRWNDTPLARLVRGSKAKKGDLLAAGHWLLYLVGGKPAFEKAVVCASHVHMVESSIDPLPTWIGPRELDQLRAKVYAWRRREGHPAIGLLPTGTLALRPIWDYARGTGEA